MQMNCHKNALMGAGATGAAGAAAPVALVVRGQRGGSEVPFLKNWFRRNVNAVKNVI